MCNLIVGCFFLFFLSFAFVCRLDFLYVLYVCVAVAFVSVGLFVVVFFPLFIILF